MDERKNKLMDLGVATLAEALLELASHVDAADELVERIIATPAENILRFKKKLASLKRSRRFIRWGESSRFARDLEELLQDLKVGVSDPQTGVDLVASFYETDKGTLGRCDDSSGIVGDVYRYTAQALFVDYASRVSEKKKIIKMLVKLNKKDAYGIRDSLIECAEQYLSEPDIRILIKEFQKLSEKEEEEYPKRHWLHLIESLARQVKDAALFEKTRASQGSLSTSAHMDIARVYLESGDVQTALSWLDKIPKNETYQADERDLLLIEIYKQLGDDEKLTQVLYRKFRSHRSIETLQDVLMVIGEDKKQEVLDREVPAILAQNQLIVSDVRFLVQIGKSDEAEAYILDRADQLEGPFYQTQLYLIDILASEKRPLPIILIYRSLLNSILERGVTKSYPHGVRYLKKLDELASSIHEWKGFDSQETYKKQIIQNHGRKKSFWSRYEG